MSAIERMMRLLQLLELSGGHISTRIKIQKLAFLAASMGVSGFKLDEFQYHYYGPYSRALSNALQQAVASEFVDEEHEGGEDQNYEKYSYKLNSRAAEFLNVGFVEDDRLSRVAKLGKDAHWRTLELAATVRFLQINDRLEFDEALKKALKLKPETADFEAPARALLAQLAN